MAKADAIKELEHVCDGHTRAIIERLNRTFVTPLDREDIHSLASWLDDVMDAIDAAAAVMRLYRIQRPPRRAAAGRHRLRVDGSDRRGASPRSKSAAACWNWPRASISSSARPTASTRTPSSRCSIRRRDPITVIKWKEIFDFLEAATDRCEDVGNLLEGVVVKHG